MRRSPASSPAVDALSVTQLLSLTKNMLEETFLGAWVQGEVVNFKEAASGHWYFTLRDAGAQVARSAVARAQAAHSAVARAQAARSAVAQTSAELRVAMFRSRNLYAGLRPENGMVLMVRGKLTVFEARGELQLVAEQIRLTGTGDQGQDLAALKAKLAAEGLFDPARKRALPRFPRRIALLTSPDAAAVQDFLVTLSRRFPLAEVELWPSLVQGEQAPKQIVEALQGIARFAERYQLLVMTRGGGASQDLSAFNDEAVVRQFSASVIPSISAVGHEIDSTLCDFVADQRAATPTAAAELIGVDQRELRRMLTGYWQRLGNLSGAKFDPLGQRLDYAKRLLDAHSPQQRMQRTAKALQQALIGLQLHMQNALHRSETKLAYLKARLDALDPRRLLPKQRLQLDGLKLRVQRAVQNQLQRHGSQLQQQKLLLDSLSPERTLERGYVIVQDATLQVLSDAALTQPAQTLRLRFRDGSVDVIRK